VAILLRERYRLMRQRLHSRWRRAIWYSILVGTITVPAIWAGWQGVGKVPTSPITLLEAIRAFPFIAVCTFVSYLLWPWRHRDEDDGPF
jgi:hypothetical protein